MKKPQGFSRGGLVELIPEYTKSTYYGLRVLTDVELQESLSVGFIEPNHHVLLVPGRPYEVVKTRLLMTRLQQGYGSYTGRMEVKCFMTGTQFYVRRQMFKPL
jgi:hypothetical protein